MRGYGKGYGLLAACLLMGAAGCASMTDQRVLQAANRTLQAEKQALTQDLFDATSANENLRTRLESDGRELRTKGDLVANLQRENELLDEMRKTAMAELEAVAKGQMLTNIEISGPMLPQQLHDVLKQFAGDHPTSVVYDAARGNVKWKSDLLFTLGSDTVKETSKEPLRRFTEILKSPAAEGFEAIVVGHTDDTPIVRAATKAKHPTNWHLSVHRAIAVAQIIKKNGFAPQRIGVMGFGEYRPIADGSTRAGDSQNRRVEIYILPKGTVAQVASAWPKPAGG